MPDVNPSSKTLYSLQLLRFVASIFVVCFHVGLMQSGYKGVDVFFVISGFVMYYSSVISKRNNWVVFAINRATKIYLLYWMVLLAYYFVQPFGIDMSLLKTLLLLPGHRPILDVSWSLSYELYFYVLFAAIVYIINKRLHNWAFMSLLVISTTITILNTTALTLKSTALNFFIGQNLWEFLLGIMTAYLFERVSIPKYMAGIGAVAIGCSITIISIGYAKPVSYLVYGCLSFMVVAFFTQFEKSVPFNTTVAKLMQSAGDASYAIYLTGPVVIALMQPASTPQKIMVVVIIVAAALFINKLIESPLLRLSRHALREHLGKGNGNR
jgi:exopolysaccharide production protein ExoZ